MNNSWGLVGIIDFGELSQHNITWFTHISCIAMRGQTYIEATHFPHKKEGREEEVQKSELTTHTRNVAAYIRLLVVKQKPQ